jgi:hypothetical protein
MKSTNDDVRYTRFIELLNASVSAFMKEVIKPLSYLLTTRIKNSRDRPKSWVPSNSFRLRWYLLKKRYKTLGKKGEIDLFVYFFTNMIHH